MSQGFLSRSTAWLAVAFVAGSVAGFSVALIWPHPPSAYRADLDEQRSRFL